MSSTALVPAIHHWISGSAGTRPAMQTDNHNLSTSPLLVVRGQVAGEQINRGVHSKQKEKSVTQLKETPLFFLQIPQVKPHMVPKTLYHCYCMYHQKIFRKRREHPGWLR